MMGHGDLRNDQAMRNNNENAGADTEAVGVLSATRQPGSCTTEPKRSTDSTDESSVDCESIFKKEAHHEEPKDFDEKSLSSQSEEDEEREDDLPGWMPRIIEFDPNAENIVEREEREMKEQRKKKRSCRKHKQPKLKQTNMSDMLSNESQHSNTSSLAAPRVPQRTNSNDKQSIPSPSSQHSEHQDNQQQASHQSPSSKKSYQEPPKRSVARSTGSLGAGSLTGMIMQMSATSLNHSPQNHDSDSYAHSSKSSLGRNSLSARGSMSARTSLGLLSRSDHQIIMSPDQPRGRKSLHKNQNRSDGDASDQSSWDSQESFVGDDDEEEEGDIGVQGLSTEEETLIRAFAAKTGALDLCAAGSVHSQGSARQRLSLGSRKSLSGRKLQSSSSIFEVNTSDGKRHSLRRSVNDGVQRNHSAKSLDPLSVSDHSRLLRSPGKHPKNRDPLSVSDHSRLARKSPRKTNSKLSLDAVRSENDDSAILRSSVSSNKSHKSSSSGKSRTSLRRSKARSSLRSHKDGKSPRPRLLKAKRDRMPTESPIAMPPDPQTHGSGNVDNRNQPKGGNQSSQSRSGMPICISLESLSSNDNDAVGDEDVGPSTGAEKQTCAVEVQ